MKRILLFLPFVLTTCFTTSLLSQVNIYIDVSEGKKTVSPYIYGKNNTTSGKVNNPLTTEQWTQVRESGATILRENYGNESTKYNWKRKLTSSPDWYNTVSNYDWDFEAKSIQDNLPNVQAMFGFQLLGYAAKSKDHNWPAWTYHVENNTPWPPCNPLQNLAGGGEPNMTNPSSSKAAVEGDINLYLENFSISTSVQILDHWFDSGGLGLNKDMFRYWAIDNEPDLWAGTHDDVVKKSLTAGEFMERYFEAAKLARSKYPNIKLVGPVTSGEWFWYNWPGGGTYIDGKKVCWLEYFIKSVADEQKAAGIRLLDVLAIHFYPGEKTNEQIVQTHRIFFDENYSYPGANGVFAVNGGWDTSIKKEYVFKRCNDWLNKYMGTGHKVTFGITECGIKTENANTAAVWHASMLGEFMRNGVELFTPWTWRKGMWETLHLFSRYNKPYYIQSVSDNEELVSAYPTLSISEDTLVIVLVNRSVTDTKSATVNLKKFILGDQKFKMRTLSELPDGETFISHYKNALKTTEVEKNGNSITVSLPPMSVSSLVLISKEKPAISAAEVENAAPSELILQLSLPVTLPVSSSGFLVRANNTDTIDITQALRSSQDSSVLLLTLERPLTKTDSVVISYSGGTIMTFDSLFLKTVSDLPVDNLLNGAAPHLKSVKTDDPKSLLLSFNKKMKFALKDGFNVYFTSGSKAEIAIDSAKFKDNDSTLIVFHIPTAIVFKDSLKITYTGDTMMSVDSGYLKPFEKAIENTILPPAPNLDSAYVTDFGYSITLQFDLDMFYAFAEIDYFTVKANDMVLNISKLETNTKKVIVHLKDVVNSGESVKISYSGGNLASMEGGKAESFTDYVVTNTLPPFTIYNVPGKIEAENSAIKNGTLTQKTNDVGGGLNVASIDNNDWLEYAINVENAGTYTICLRIASHSSAGKIIVQLPGNNFAHIDTIDLPVTGGWQIWTTVISYFELEPGVQRIRFFAQKGGFNINWFELIQGILTVSNPGLSDQIQLFPSPTNGNVEFMSPEIVNTVEILDFLGKTIYNTQVNSTGTVLEIADILTPGIYFMKFYAGDTVVIKRFIRK